MTPYIITVSHAGAAYDGKTVLEDININICENDFVGIIGPNGGGKTTLVRLILGLMKPETGLISYFRCGRPADDIRFGYLPQQNNIDRKFPISVYDTVMSGLIKEKPLFRDFSRSQHVQTQTVMNKVGIADIAGRQIGTLSGGQLQKVLLARAIVSNPEILVLDEPNTYVDRKSQEQMFALLHDIGKHCTIVIVSHDIDSILHNAKHIVCVNRNVRCFDRDNFKPADLKTFL